MPSALDMLLWIPYSFNPLVSKLFLEESVFLATFGGELKVVKIEGIVA